MIMLANTKEEIQADPRAMRKKPLTSILYCFYQDADAILHHPSRRQLGIINPRALKSLTPKKERDTK